MNNSKTKSRLIRGIGFCLAGLLLLVGCKKGHPDKDLEYIQGQIFTEYKSYYAINQLNFLFSNWYDQFKTAYNKANRETVTLEQVLVMQMFGVNDKKYNTKDQVKKVYQYFEAIREKTINAVTNMASTTGPEKTGQELEKLIEALKDSTYDYHGNAQLAEAFGKFPELNLKQRKNMIDRYTLRGDYQHLASQDLTQTWHTIFKNSNSGYYQIAYLFAQACDKAFKDVNKMRITYIVKKEKPEESRDYEKENIVNTTYEVGFSNETAIVCDITTNKTNEKAKFEFQPIEYNSILEGEGIIPKEK